MGFTNPLTLPAAVWSPDRATLKNPGSTIVTNVIPASSESYGPMASLQAYADAISARCQGAFATSDSSGNVYVFAGDATKLYKLVAGSTAFSNVSGAAYNIATDERWVYALFGSRVIALNIGDPQQVYELGVSATFGDLSATAPQARYGATIRGFFMVANTYDVGDGLQPQRVWWSAVNDCTNWPTPGTSAAAQVQSDRNDLLGEGGWNQGIVGNLGTADGAIFQEHAVWRVVKEGPPTTFGFYPAQGVRGTPAPGSIAQLGNLVYYIGEDGFCVFDGTSSAPIGVDMFDKTFYRDLDQTYISRIVSAVDPINKLVFWAYPGAGNSNGNPNRLIAYSPPFQRATLIETECETLLRSMSFGYTLDELYTVLGYSLDTLPFPLDSRVWTGGQVILSAFSTSHRLGYFAGANLAPTIETTELELPSGRRGLVRNARPLVEGSSITPSVSIGVRETLSDAVTYTTPVAVNALGTCPQRASGRFLRSKITLPSASDFDHLLGVELDVSQGGTR